MTYQRNMKSLSVLEIDEVLHQACEHLVEAVQVEADEHAGREHDRGRLPRLVAVREVGLRELAAHLAREPGQAADALAAVDRVATGLALGLTGERRRHAAPSGRHLLAVPSGHGPASGFPCAACACRTICSTC